MGSRCACLFLTAGRENEIAGIRLGEIRDLDGREPGLTIPGSRTKNKRDHFIPLTPLAVETIKQAKELIGDGEEYLFPSGRKKGVSRSTGTRCRWLWPDSCAAQEGKDGAAKSLRGDPPSPHDLRRTASTRMAALGVPKEDRDACLNHARVDVGKHYDLYERADREAPGARKAFNSIGEIIARQSEYEQAWLG